MKFKKTLPLVAAICISSMIFTSCIGSFSLTNRVLNWNKNVSNKFVNEVVFFAFWVLPVYEVTVAADLLVINSIEFWSGNRPLEANNKVIPTDEGNYYINAYDSGYKVVSPSGDVLNFDFDTDTQVWSFSRNDNERIDFLKFEDENHVKVLNPQGEFVDVELTRDGVDSFVANLNMPMMASL